MQIRPATDSDIPAIVDLLKISLGENLMPKSEHYWRWKHVDNPFGPSTVLLCWEGDLLLGVRAFMRWEWSYNDKIYKTVRAVDTATHPRHQGKGIFKKLTMSLVEACKLNGDDFVFNTPNAQSKPGYLKMGWQENGRFPIVVGLQRPTAMVRSLIRKKGQDSGESTTDGRIEQYLNHKKISSLISQYSGSGTIATKISVPYLKWRYCDVPVATYVAVGVEDSGFLTGLVICRLKESRVGKELRITDCFIKNQTAEKELILRLKQKKKDWKIDYCTVSGVTTPGIMKFAGRYRWKFSAGPMVTVRPLLLTDLSILRHFKQWSPSIGDLELF